MTKAEFVEKVAKNTKTKKKTVASIVEAMFDSIEATLAKGGKCTFVGFGVFEVKDRAAREGRNPQEPTKVIKIPARKVPIFRPGKAFKEKIRTGKKKK